jgi:hypothetical protein
MITVKEAREQKIYVVENGAVEETTLYEHVIKSLDETTTPRGVGARMFYEQREIENLDSIPFLNDLCRDAKEETECFEICTWGFIGNHHHKLDEFFSTEEAAEDHLFNLTFDYDFQKDDQRNTMYYDIYEDAVKDFAEIHNISFDSALSYLSHQKLANKIKKDRKEKYIIEANERKNALQD